MNNIAIIPARSGSKGLQDKNIRLFNGKPLIAYAIEAAKESELFKTLMVSTDSEKYAEIARQYGAEVPFLRSEKTSSDTASSWDMVEEVLKKYENLGKGFETFCLLQPTSPLRSVKDLKEAYRIYISKNATAVVSVCELEHPITWCNTLDDTLSLEGFICKKNNQQRQKQASYFRLNGAVYIMNTKAFLKDHNIYCKGSYAYIMPLERSVDIDTERDFKLAEFFMREYAEVEGQER